MVRAEQAADQLNNKLRPHSWYLSTGVGETSTGVALFVYVKSARHSELTALRNGWKGYPVFIRSVGSVKPVIEEDHQIPVGAR